MSSEAGYAPEFETSARKQMAKQNPLAQREGAIIFEAPAAGGRTRAEVLRELQQARDDGSPRRLNTNRHY